MMIDGEKVFAEYLEQVLPENKNNLLIEALPKKLDQKQAMRAFKQKIAFNQEELNLDPEDREECPERLRSFVWPLHEYYDFYKSVRRAIVSGYRLRNPLDPKVIRHIYDNAILKDPDKRPNVKTTADTVMVMGLSGMGKSTMVESVLSHIYQVVIHENYKGKAIRLEQVVWLKVDCPVEASRRALCLSFFKAMDKVTGGVYEYYKTNNRIRGIEALLQSMQTVAAAHFLGVLVIDEMQNMSLAKAGGEQKLLHLFDSMANQLGVPLVYVGTTKALSVFTGQLRSARRSATGGLIEMYNPPRDDELLELFVKKIWRYQWVIKPVELTEHLQELIYELTQGITVFITNLMCWANQLAIEEGLDTIDEDVLIRTYQTKFKMVHKALTALRENKIDAFDDLMRLEDLVIDETDVDIVQNNMPQPEKSAIENVQEAANTREFNVIPLSREALGMDLRTLEVTSKGELIEILSCNDLFVDCAYAKL